MDTHMRVGDDGAMPESTVGAAPEQRLARAKRALQEALAHPPGIAPRQITARTPIAAVPASVAERAQVRAEAGLDPLGTDSPRAPMFKRVVVPSTLLAVLDAVLLIIAIASGNEALATTSAILFAVFGGVALASRHYVARDPLRLTARDRLAVAKASSWRSQQNWSGRTDTRECALVSAAADAGARIATSRAWTSGELARSGVVLALGTELDQVDAVTTTSLDADDWERLTTRVAALSAYAEAVADLPGDSLEPDDVEALAFFLSGAIYKVH